MSLAVRELAPLRVFIGPEDVTSIVADSGGTFSSVDPGGYEACSLNFPRDMPETLRGQHVLITAGLRTAWEGRVSQVTRSLSHNTTIMGEGYGAVFKDAAASMVFVDRDLTRWQQPSYPRQYNLVAINAQPGSFQVGPDPVTDNPALVLQIADSWVSPYKPLTEAWYDAGPYNVIARLWYDVTFDASLAGLAFLDQLVVSNDASADTTVAQGNLYVSPFGEVSGYWAPLNQYRYALAQHEYTATPAGNQGAQYNSYWHNMAVYGAHGLPGRGADPVGFYPSDIFSWVMQQMVELKPGVVQTTDSGGYIVPHSVYYTPVTLDTMVNDMATVQGWHWGVWESQSPLIGDPTPRADFRPRAEPGSPTAFFRRGACQTCDIREDLSQQFNLAYVNYTDTAGVQQSVLVGTDNPILDEAGIPGRAVVFSGGTMDAATATLFGEEALALTNAQARVAGTAEIIAPIDGPYGYMPAFLLKPGIDRPRVGDVPSVDAWGSESDYPLTRMEASISSSGITTSLEFGTGGSLVETLQARLQAATALAGQGAA